MCKLLRDFLMLGSLAIASVLSWNLSSLQAGTFEQNIRSESPLKWDGLSSIWINGSGTKEDPYLIESPKMLAYLSAQVAEGNDYKGLYFRQTADFDMGYNETLEKEALNKNNFIPIGVYDAGDNPDTGVYEDFSKPFNGNYDGDGHRILALYCNYGNYTVSGAGLFGYIGGEGVVSNLNLSSHTEGFIAASGFASYIAGKVINCHIDADVYSESNSSCFCNGLLNGAVVENVAVSGIAKGEGAVSAFITYTDALPEVKDPAVVKHSYVVASYSSVSSAMACGNILSKMLAPIKMENCYFAISYTGESVPSDAGRFSGPIYNTDVLDSSSFSNCYLANDLSPLVKSFLSEPQKESLDGITELTSKEMKDDTFIAKLGEGYAKDETNVNEGYPVFKFTNTSVSNPIYQTLVTRVFDGCIYISGMSSGAIAYLFDMNGHLLAFSENNEIRGVSYHGACILVVEGEHKSIVKLTI